LCGCPASYHPYPSVHATLVSLGAPAGARRLWADGSAPHPRGPFPAHAVCRYAVRTRRVLDFYVTTAHGRATDYRPWLQLVGVPAQDPRWSIEPFAMPGAPGLYLGVRVAAQ
jgi:hypothetical protein